MPNIPIGRITLIIVLIFLVVKRANLVAIFAKRKYAQKDYAGALKIFKAADKIGNLNVGNRTLMGYVFLRLGDLENASKSLRYTMTLTKRDSADRNQIKNLLALVYWKEGNLDEAIEELEEVVDSGYKNTSIYQNLGILYNLSGNVKKALEFNQEAWEYNKDDNIIADNLADAYAIAGEYEKSAEIYEDMMGRDPTPHFPEAFYGYGKVLIQLGQKERGMELIKESMSKPFSYLSIRPKSEIEELYRENGGVLEDDNNSLEG